MAALLRDERLRRRLGDAGIARVGSARHTEATEQILHSLERLAGARQ
jgi:hypothetical protein